MKKQVPSGLSLHLSALSRYLSLSTKGIILINKIKEEVEMGLSPGAAHQIFMLVTEIGKIEGDLAEVGVYKGTSAKVICEAKGDRPLHLFDTFEGLPDVDEIDYPAFHKGQYTASFENVRDYLKEYRNVYFYKGLFPITAELIKNKKFSFVHLDTDIYKSTLACLDFFYPRMNRGGIIISHDYSSSAGVKKAFDEFLEDKIEPIITLPESQCLIVKLSEVE